MSDIGVKNSKENMDGSNFECRTKMFTNYLLTSVFLLQNNRMTADNFIIGGLHRDFMSRRNN